MKRSILQKHLAQDRFRELGKEGTGTAGAAMASAVPVFQDFKEVENSKAVKGE